MQPKILTTRTFSWQEQDLLLRFRGMQILFMWTN